MHTHIYIYISLDVYLLAFLGGHPEQCICIMDCVPSDRDGWIATSHPFRSFGWAWCMHPLHCLLHVRMGSNTSCMYIWLSTWFPLDAFALYIYIYISWVVYLLAFFNGHSNNACMFHYFCTGPIIELHLHVYLVFGWVLMDGCIRYYIYVLSLVRFWQMGVSWVVCIDWSSSVYIILDR